MANLSPSALLIELVSLRGQVASARAAIQQAEERAQKLTDEHVAKIDEILKRKEEEIMEV